MSLLLETALQATAVPPLAGHSSGAGPALSFHEDRLILLAPG